MMVKGGAFLVAGVLTAVACGGDSKEKAATTSTASATTATATARTPGLTVMHGDETIVLSHAYVVSEGTSALTLRLTELPFDCEQVETGIQANLAKGRQVVLLLAHKLMPDGKRKWVLSRGQGYAFGKETLRDDRKKPGAVNVATADPRKGLSASVVVELRDDEVPKALRVEGDVLAEGCGIKPSSRKSPPEHPQPDLKLTVAGQAFDVKGAKLTLEKDRKVLNLTTAPQDCSFNAAGEIGFSLGLIDKGGVHAFLRGDAIQNNLNTSGDLAIEAKLGAKAGDRQEVELSGETTMFDYEVAVSGKVSAVVCDNR